MTKKQESLVALSIAVCLVILGISYLPMNFSAPQQQAAVVTATTVNLPTSVLASPGPGGIKFIWNAIPGATSYTLTWTATHDSSYTHTSIIPVTVTYNTADSVTYTDTTLNSTDKANWEVNYSLFATINGASNQVVPPFYIQAYPSVSHQPLTPTVQRGQIAINPTDPNSGSSGPQAPTPPSTVNSGLGNGVCPTVGGTPTICNVQLYKYKSVSGTSAGDYGIYLTWDRSPGITGAYIFSINAGGVVTLLGRSASSTYLWLPSLKRTGTYTFYVVNFGALAIPAKSAKVTVHLGTAVSGATLLPNLTDIKTVAPYNVKGAKIPVGGVHDGTANDNDEDGSAFWDLSSVAGFIATGQPGFLLTGN